MSSSTSHSNEWHKYLLSFVMGSFFSLVGTISINSSDIPWLCDRLGNCAKQQQRLDTYPYSWAVGQAIAASTLAKKAQNIEQFQEAPNLMKDAISQLGNISSSASLYPEAQKLIPGYQRELTEMEARLTQEAKAKQLLDEAEQLARDAAESSKTARIKSKLSESKDLWEKAIAKINQIPANSLIAHKAKARSEEYENEIKKINEKIDRSLY